MRLHPAAIILYERFGDSDDGRHLHQRQPGSIIHDAAEFFLLGGPAELVAISERTGFAFSRDWTGRDRRDNDCRDVQPRRARLPESGHELLLQRDGRIVRRLWERDNNLQREHLLWRCFWSARSDGHHGCRSLILFIDLAVDTGH